MPDTRAAVLIVSSGDLEHNGGIGRQMKYFLSEVGALQPAIEYRLIDSRGPWDLAAAPLYRIPAGLYFLSALIKALWLNATVRPCLAHINIAGRGSTVRKVVFASIGRMFGLRYVLHLHDYDYAQDFSRRGRFMQRMVTRIFRHAAAVLVLGERDRRSAEELFGVAPERAIVLHNAVPDPGAHAPHAAQRPCHLLFLGQLSARKGVPELLQALATPALGARAWHATLAGGGPVAEFREQARQAGLAERIAFPGWVDEPTVRALCADADVLLLPSHAEGMAISVLEGLAHGLAVITTPVGGHPEVIEPEVSGLFVAPGDVEGLAASLVRVIDDPDLRAALGQGARRRFLEAFAVRGYAARLTRLHQALLGIADPAARSTAGGQQ